MGLVPIACLFNGMQTMNSRVWSHPEFLTEFIDLYKNRPCLWKVKSENYTNRVIKDEAYNDLLDLCRLTDPAASVELVKNKINSIRTSYRKELTKINKSIRAGVSKQNVYKPKLWYFYHLDFLREEDGLCFSRSSNLSVDDIVDEQSLETSTLDEEDEPRENDSEQRRIGDQSTAQKAHVKPTIRSDQHFPKHRLSLPNRQFNSEREQDEFDALGVSVSKKLRKMDRLQQLFAENLINKALFLGSMGQLNINSDVQPISCYSSDQSPSSSSTFT